MTNWLPTLLVGVASGLTAWGCAAIAIRRAPTSLVRTNVAGDEVPAVLGWGVLAGGCIAAATAGIYIAFGYGDLCEGRVLCGLRLSSPWELAWGPLVPIVGMFLAGTWDDLRGDERPRGFGGHLAAARGGALTGGVVKLVVGAAVALLTIAALDKAVPPIGDWLLAAAPIALAANLINLFDRAPGRALKVFLLVAVPLAVLVPATRILLAGALGAAAGLLGLDLKAKGMLGDAGANPLGAILGLAMFVAVAEAAATTMTLPRIGLGALVVLLVALNLASEKWSFSRIIETTPWLARLDHLGRK